MQGQGSLHLSALSAWRSAVDDESNRDAGYEPVTAGHSVELATELAKRGIELGTEIGRGAMAVVYRGHDLRHDRPLAVKVMSYRAADAAAAERFALEIKVIARLRHPNIVPLIDSGTTPSGDTFFLMPLALGENARARLKRAGPLPLPDAVRYAREIAEALAYAHGEGLIHRDVKPENILLEGGHAVLGDFGVARETRPELDGSDPTTATGLVVGTPAYMSPEQLLAGGPIDGRADLYSLGVTFYELASGRLPFPSAGMPALLAERLAGKFEPLSSVCPAAPAALDAILGRVLAPDPADRYSDGGALAADLAQVEAALTSGSAVRSPRSHARLGFVAGVLVAAIVAAAAIRTRSPRIRLDPNRIVVADMQNETGDSSLATIGPRASDWISAGLTGIPGLTVINSEYVLGAPRRHLGRRTPSTSGRGIRSLVDSTRAAIVVSGSYYRESGRLEVFAEITDARTGNLLLALGPLLGSPTKPDSVLAMVRDSIATFIRAARGASTH